MDSLGCQLLFTKTSNVIRAIAFGLIGNKAYNPSMPRKGEVFILVDEQRRTLFGPFRVVVEQYQSEVPVNFFSVPDPSQPSEEVEEERSWILGFEPCGLGVKSQFGIVWSLAAEILGMPVESWSVFGENALSESQQIKLRDEMRVINKAGLEYFGSLLVDKLNMDDNSWTVFIDKVNMKLAAEELLV